MRPVYRHINQTGGDGPALIAEIAMSWALMAAQSPTDAAEQLGRLGRSFAEMLIVFNRLMLLELASAPNRSKPRKQPE
jgi:hypothetical protein